MSATDDILWGEYQTQPRTEPPDPSSYSDFPSYDPATAPDPEAQRCLQLAQAYGAAGACADPVCYQYNPSACDALPGAQRSPVLWIAIGAAVLGLGYLAWRQVKR
jgi:hypothetical protein